MNQVDATLDALLDPAQTLSLAPAPGGDPFWCLAESLSAALLVYAAECDGTNQEGRSGQLDVIARCAEAPQGHVVGSSSPKAAILVEKSQYTSDEELAAYV